MIKKGTELDVPITIRVAPEIYTALTDLAELYDWSVSKTVRKLVENFCYTTVNLNNNNKKEH